MVSYKNPASGPFKLITTPTSQLPDGHKVRQLIAWVYGQMANLTQPDQFYRCASEMACVHNMVIGGLNSIYLQAPHIHPKDEGSFLQYCACFYEVLHIHHSGEEAYMFPAVEEMSGEKGIMECNVEQHQAFDAGLGKYNQYVQDCLKGTKKYNGSELVAIIDEFGPILVTHLTEEIPTILSLAKYGDKMKDFEKVFLEMGEKDMVRILGLLNEI